LQLQAAPSWRFSSAHWSSEYGYDASDAILLERKDDMRMRGLASPDDGVALALNLRLSSRPARLGRRCVTASANTP
jgi:hypothetical protein